MTGGKQRGLRLTLALTTAATTGWVLPDGPSHPGAEVPAIEAEPTPTALCGVEPNAPGRDRLTDLLAVIGFHCAEAPLAPPNPEQPHYQYLYVTDGSGYSSAFITDTSIHTVTRWSHSLTGPTDRVIDPDDMGEVDRGNGRIDLIHGDTDLGNGELFTLSTPEYPDLLRVLNYLRTQHQAGVEAYQANVASRSE